MALEFGIFDHLDLRAGEPLAQTYAQRLILIQAAEQAGFRNYHLAEHHGTPLGMAPSPGVFLAAVASHTSKIKFGPLVYIAPAYLPMRLLEEICMLDNLSNGRFEFAMGRGASPVEMAYCGLDPDATIELCMEVEEIISKGLHAEFLTHHGKYYHYENVPITVKPVQKPIPMWSAAKSPQGQDLASKRGMHSISLGSNDMVMAVSTSYREYWHKNRNERAASAPQQPYIGAYRLIFVHEDGRLAEQIGRSAFEDWCAKLEKLWKENNISTPFMSVLGSFDIACECGMMVCGTPTQVVDILKQQEDETGINYFALQVAYGNLGHAEEMRSLERIASKVMPACRTS